MITITPKRKDITHPIRNKKYSSTIRLWHWLNALVITGSLLTVLLHSTIMGAWDNGKLIKSNLAQKGVSVTDDQARSAAHEISDKAWAVHTYLGYALGVLFLFRLIIEYFQLTDQVLIRKMKSAYKQYYVVKKNRELSRHEFWIKTLYAIFYMLLLITVITGFCLAFEDNVPALKHMHFIREIHQFNLYLILAFIIVHLAGVFLAERKDSKGIISDMVNGGAE